MSHDHRLKKGVFFYEAVFYQDEDGRVYSNGNIGREALTLYLACVEHLQVFCRLHGIRRDDARELVEISAPGLSFHGLGLKSWTRLPLLLPWVWLVLARAWLGADVAILRLPSIVSILMRPVRWLGHRPVIVELVSDPRGLLKSAYPRLPGVAWLDRALTGATRRWVAQADGCVYVTRETLQAIYPCGGDTSYASNVRIERIDPDTLSQRLTAPPLAGRQVLNVGLIGSLSNEYKGIDVAIEAVARLNKAGLPVHLHVLGKGPLLEKYQAQAARLGCQASVHFAGTRRKGEEVLAWLASMDAYIQPSRVEGLPRALVEAMSVGLPCVATSVGGIPELLAAPWRVPAEDAGSLADKLQALLSDDNVYRQQCQANFETARDFLYDTIVARKAAFLQRLGARLAC
ncbi:glycosyltransferase [Alloalcanivorax mobilis]|uniref:glycosyltransferase n=1 Tax=Alloalcanivorax mobilis TaxID=2019569 RepID=UPI000C762E08|nr:glycosyltransferase [Alloalcanivorax mobilis]